LPNSTPQLSLSLKAAHNTQRWVRVIAKRYHCPAAVMRHQLRTARNLEEEVAPIIADYILAEARALNQGDNTLADDDVSVLSVAIRRCAALLAPTQALPTRQALFGGTPVKTLKDYETDAPVVPREQQDSATQARLDAQTNDILALLKADQRPME